MKWTYRLKQGAGSPLAEDEKHLRQTACVYCEQGVCDNPWINKETMTQSATENRMQALGAIEAAQRLGDGGPLGDVQREARHRPLCYAGFGDINEASKETNACF